MLTASEEQQAALRTHQKGSVRGSAFYKGQLVASVNVVPSGAVGFNGDGEIQSSTSVTIVGQAPSLVPRVKTDPLAPFGQELALWRVLEFGGRTWEIPLGRFRITDVTSSQEYLRGDVVTGFEVELALKDRFEQIRADDFLEVVSPIRGATCYEELRRLVPIPVQESLPDQPVPAATVYESRIAAIETLCSLMGGAPHLTREGVLTVRPKDAWLTATEPQFDIKGVISWQEGMSNDYFNQVQVKSSNNNDLVAFRSISDPSNPLHPSIAGGRTYKHSAPIYQTQAAVNAAAETILARVSTRRSRVVDVVCGPEAMLLELGDFGWFRDPRTKRAALGEIASMSIPLDLTAGVPVSVIVSEEF